MAEQDVPTAEEEDKTEDHCDGDDDESADRDFFNPSFAHMKCELRKNS